MKNVARILNLIASVLVIIIGAAFAFIEGYLLFSGDFLLFESQLLAFLQMLLRLCMAAGTITLGLFTIIKKDKSFLYESIVALICTIVISPFLTNGFGLYFIILAALFVLSNLFYAKQITK